MSVYIQRRNYITASAFAAGLAFVPNKSEALALSVLQITLGLIAAGGGFLTAKVAADRAADSQKEVLQLQLALERARFEYQFKLMRYEMGDESVIQEVAFASDGSLARQGWSGNVDGYGTYAGLANGRIGVERHHSKGTITTVEGRRFASGMARNGAPMPVPVEDGYHSLSPARAEMVKDDLARIGKRNIAIIGGRHYSSASKPTSGGWDVETILFANSDKIVDAAIIGR